MPTLEVGVFGLLGSYLGSEYNQVAKIAGYDWTKQYEDDPNYRVSIVDGDVQLFRQGGYMKPFVKAKVSTPKGSCTGYVPKETLDVMNVSTVNIPANFAGLEAVDVPTRLQYQLFRIVEVVENEDYVEVTARHIWYDNLKNYTTWEPTAETSYTAASVCRNILTNAITSPNSRVASDCTDTKKGDQLDYKNKNLVECFLDPEDGVCAKFGLSLLRDNNDFYCLKDVGYDRGFVVENGKNLLGVERTESIENVATRIAAFGKDSKGEIVWLDNNGKKYVDSTNIGDYSEPMIELLDTGITIGKDGVTAQNIQEKLLAAAQKRFSEDHVDLPEVEMTIEFVSLGDTEEYAQYRGLDKVYLYDIITVKDTVRGYNYTAQIIGVEHDILTGMLNSVTIGKLDNWDGTRKIATWQVPEVNGENIRLKSILAGSFAPGAIQSLDMGAGIIQYVHIARATIDDLTADALTAARANIEELIAGSVTADSIKTDDLEAINAKLGTAEIAISEIQKADIDYGKIKDLNAQSAFFGEAVFHDAIGDKLFVPRLMVGYAQMVQATVNDLAIKASDGNYYHLDVLPNGAVSATQITVTPEEEAQGHTSDGLTILETDIIAENLATRNIYATHGLMGMLTAEIINVDQLFAREATIAQLNVVDISGNNYIRSMVAEKSTTYDQTEDPTLTHDVKRGDLWICGGGLAKWSDLTNKTWNDMFINTWESLGGSVTYIWNGSDWEVLTNRSQQMIESGKISIIEQTQDQIILEVRDKYEKKAGIDINDTGVEIYGSKQVWIKSDGKFIVESGNLLIDETRLDVLNGTLKGNHLTADGKRLLSENDIYIGTTAPAGAAGKIWIKPVDSTSVIYSRTIPSSGHTHPNGYSSTLTTSGAVSSASGTKSYRLQMVIHADTSSGTGLDVTVTIANALVYQFHAHQGQYSGGQYDGDTEVDMTVTSATWYGDSGSLPISITATGFNDYYDIKGEIRLTATGSGSSGSGWKDTEIKVYQ